MSELISEHCSGEWLVRDAGLGGGVLPEMDSLGRLFGGGSELTCECQGKPAT